MNSDNLIFIAQHQFKVLRKFMYPLYAELRFHENESSEFKIEFCRKLIPRFFSRVRSFRNVSLEQISKHSGSTVEEIIEFENGTYNGNKKILEETYAHVCGADGEPEYLFELIEEFMNPACREAKKVIAKNFSKITGLKFQTIRYDVLESQEHNVVTLITTNT